MAAVGKDGQQHLFLTLDMLRGVAAIAVAGRHLNHEILSWLPSSYLAVDLFFVLSGFVIAHAYEQRLRTNLGVLEFFRMRIIRLYPLYILGTALGIAAVVVQNLTGKPGAEWSLLVASILFATAFLPATPGFSYNHAHLYPLNFPAWSLCWEIAINIVYAAIARHLNSARLGAIVIAGAFLLVLCVHIFGNLDGGANFPDFVQGPMRVVYSFFAGIGLYRLYLNGAAKFVRLPSWVIALILLAVFVIRPADEELYDLAVTLIVFPLLVLAGANEPERPLRRVYAALGAISYPLYALHIPIANLELAAYSRWGERANALTLPLEITLVVSMIIFALLADRFYDRDIRRWLTKRIVRRKPPVAVNTMSLP